MSYLKTCRRHKRCIYRTLCRYFSDVQSNKQSNVDVVFSNGRNLNLSSGKLARFADGCAVAQLGDTSVMVTVVGKTKPTSASFLPLVVDYRQKAAAAGRIPTNHLRRELGPSEREILTSRLIDRSLRPMFLPNYNYETQVMCNILAMDSSNSPDILAINAASAAISLSDIPWLGPVGAVRVGLSNGELLVNPTRRELQSSSLDLVLTATRHNLVVMMEAAADNVLQQDLLKAIKKGTQEAQNVVSAIEKMQKTVGKEKRQLEPQGEVSHEVLQAVHTLSDMRLKEIFRDFTHDKLSRDNAVNSVRNDVIDKVRNNFPDVEAHQITDTFAKICKQIFRDLVLEEDKRCDGRGLTQLRDISCQVDLYRPLHGSALFQRGQTQVFATITLDSPESALKLDPVSMITSGVKEKNFFVHYEFPPFATKETGRVGGAGRRELGHGALAERGLLPVIPADHPFTIRLMSEVLESNGSSSMASVCAGSLALLDAGVPLVAPAAGVAIGLIANYQNNDTKHMEDYRILTDILGIEDYLGDMDFKLAGTKKGVTALQADIKIPGLPLKVVMEAVQQGSDAKAAILDIMAGCIHQPRSDRKDNWPVREKLAIEPHKRSRLLGVGGVNLKRLFAETGVQVSAMDETAWSVFAPSQQALDEAQELLQGWLQDQPAPSLEFGAIYTAKIVEVRDIGVMVTLYPGMPPALLHNSQLDQRKIAHPSALGLEVGADIQVKYFGRDPVSGLMRISRKVLQPATSRVKTLNT